MKRRHHPIPHVLPAEAESGQAIVLIALAVVVLLGFTGLAIDGGQLMLAKRDVQNAADAAAWQAAYELCSAPNASRVQDRAEEVAAINGYVQGIDGTVITTETPVNDLPAGHAGSADDYVRVTITALRPSYFIHLVYEGPLAVTARATSYCYHGKVGAAGGSYAIISLKPTGKDGYKVNGNGATTVTGGGVHINSDHSAAMFCSGNHSKLSADPIHLVGGDTCSSSNFPNQEPTPTTPMDDPLAGLAEPVDPGGSCPTVKVQNKDNVTLQPGKYCGLTVTGGKATLNPGLYYFTGPVRISGGEVNAIGVTFFMDSGDFQMTGNGIVRWTAPEAGPWAGMMLFMGRGNTSGIKISGNGNWVGFSGTIYAPDSDVDFSGNGTGFVTNAQIIAWTVQTGGNGDLTIDYKPDLVFQINDPNWVRMTE